MSAGAAKGYTPISVSLAECERESTATKIQAQKTRTAAVAAQPCHATGKWNSPTGRNQRNPR